MSRIGVVLQMLTGGAMLAGLAAATGEFSHLDPGLVSVRSWLALLYLTGPGTLLAMTCYMAALRRLPTAAVSTYAYVNPVVAVALGALLLGERLTLATLLGGAVVLLCVALLLASRPAETSPRRQVQPVHAQRRQPPADRLSQVRGCGRRHPGPCRPYRESRTTALEALVETRPPPAM